MADEQYIYLSPEEDLTSVRERLQKIPNRHIVLVVPPQTQLRSHVSWRLLHARAREQGKDVSINSPDRQIRSVAKAVGFKVVDSLEAPGSGKSRTGSGSSRFGLGSKTSPRTRTPSSKSSQPPQQPSSPAKGNKANQESPPASGNAPGQDMPAARGNASGQSTPPVRGKDPRQGMPAARGNVFEEQTPPVKGNRAEQNSPPVRRNTQFRGAPLPPVMGNMPAQGEQNLQQLDKRTWAQPEDTTTEGETPAFPSSFDNDDYSLGPSTSKHSGGSSYEDEELDLFLEDVRKAQSIREAAQPQDANTATPSAGNSVSPGRMPNITDLSSHPGEEDDPFVYLSDEETPQLHEQHGSVSIHEPDDDVHDIADVPTDALHIEDLGDTDEGFNQHPGSAGLDLSEDTTDEEQDIPGPSRVHGVRPRTNRTGGMQKPQPVRPGRGSEDVMAPPPVYDQKTSVQRKSGPMPVRGDQQTSYPVMGGGNRNPQAVPLPPARPAQAQATQARPQPGGSPTARGTRPAPAPNTRAPAPRTTRPIKQGQRKIGNLDLGVAALVSLIVFLFIGLWAYLGPSADVTLTLQSHNYPLPLKLTANSSSHMDVSNNTVPAQTLTYTTSANGSGHASGTATVGTVQATGTVTITNNGTSSVIIPNGTTVSTKNGVQFLTQAEVLVLSGSSNTNLAPVQAIQAGPTSNVPAGSITVIPQEGLTMIQHANPPNTTVNVAVNNTDRTTGGGAGTATSVTDKDVKALQQQLDIQLQASVNAFIKKNVGPKDQRGKIVQVEPAPTVTPPVGNIVTSGNFSMTLTRHITVLVVRYATIETASIDQINAALSKQGNGGALVPQQQVQITKMVNTSPSDGTSVALNYTAVGQVAPKISDDAVRQMVSGKSVNDAQRALMGTSSIPDVSNAHVTTSPSWAWVTFYTPRIYVHYNAVPGPPKTK